MHPLAGNLEHFSDEELVTKLTELHSKYSYAARKNHHFARQIFFLIDDYNNEVQRRNTEADKKVKEQLGEDFFSDNIDIK